MPPAQLPFFDVSEVALRLGAALVLGALLGLDREIRRKPAGLKTLALVSLGSAGFALFSVQAIVSIPVAQNVLRFDPGRIAQAVAEGVGFLGAGVILNSGGDVRFLTTAGSIWAASAIGLACGFGQLVLAALLCGFALFVLIILNVFEKAITGGRKDKKDEREPTAYTDVFSAPPHRLLRRKRDRDRRD